MSIFRRENVSSSPADAGGPSDPGQKRHITRVAPGTRLLGEVTGATEVLIDGEIEGEVRVDATVTVGAEGAVTGAVSAPVIRVAGRVVGNLLASDRVEVSPSGSVEGDIAAPRIVIAEGAFFKGRVEMTGENVREARPPRGAGAPELKPAAEPGKP